MQCCGILGCRWTVRGSCRGDSVRGSVWGLDRSCVSVVTEGKGRWYD